jgi:hypothetical protein
MWGRAFHNEKKYLWSTKVVQVWAIAYFLKFSDVKINLDLKFIYIEKSLLLSSFFDLPLRKYIKIFYDSYIGVL